MAGFPRRVAGATLVLAALLLAGANAQPFKPGQGALPLGTLPVGRVAQTQLLCGLAAQRPMLSLQCMHS